MHKASFVAMAAWLALWGCDGDDKTSPTVMRGADGQMIQVDWSDRSGCDDGKSKVRSSDGRTGTIKVDWEYVPAAVTVSTCLIFVVFAARRTA